MKVAYYADGRRSSGTVPPTVFVPKPKVESALVRLVRHADAAGRGRATPTRMFELVRAGFATRRKTLRNALDGRLGDRRRARSRRAGIDPQARAETLDLADWAAARRCVRSRGCASTRSPSSRSRCTSPARAPTATTSSTRSMVSVSEPHDELVDPSPRPRTSIDGHRPVRGGRAGRRVEPRVARRATRAARTVEHRAAQGHPAGRRARRRLGRRGRGARRRARRPTPDVDRGDARRRRAVLPAQRRARAHARHRRRARAGRRCPTLVGRDRDAAVRLLDRRRVPRVGRARRSAATGRRRLPPSQRPRAGRAARRAAPRRRSSARSRPRPGAPALLAGSGSSYAVVFDDTRRRRAARARIADAVDGSAWLGATVDAGVTRAVRTSDAKRPPHGAAAAYLPC